VKALNTEKRNKKQEAVLFEQRQKQYSLALGSSCITSHYLF